MQVPRSRADEDPWRDGREESKRATVQHSAPAVLEFASDDHCSFAADFVVNDGNIENDTSVALATLNRLVAMFRSLPASLWRGL